MKYSKIYTGRGNNGTTSLWNGERVSKTDKRIKTVGVLDELNAIIGVIHAYAFCNRELTIRRHTAEALTALMGEVAGYSSQHTGHHLDSLKKIHDELVQFLDEHRKPLNGWQLYGENGLTSAYFDLASTIARRAEISVLELDEPISDEWLEYLNLLSKVLFLFARK